MLGTMALGFSAQIGLVIGLILALSSTAIVLQTLTERGLIKGHGGRSIFAVLLAQDIAVIPILAALPLFVVQSVALRQYGSISRPQTTAGLDVTPTIRLTHANENRLIFSLFDSLPGWGITLLTLSLVAAIILAITYLIRPIFRFNHVTGLREIYTA